MKNCTHNWRKWYVQATLILFFSLLSFTGFSQLVAKGLTAANGTFIGFYQFTPYDYNPNQTPKYPLMIFLHGIGERGNGTTNLPAVLGNGTPKNINEGHTMRFFWNGKWETFIVLIPQLSTSYGWWQNFYVDEMIKYAKANLNIDPNRITLTGLSLGGGGVWAWAGASAANAQTGPSSAATAVEASRTCLKRAVEQAIGLSGPFTVFFQTNYVNENELLISLTTTIERGRTCSE